MKLHFLRHGRTLANEQGLYYGSTDLPLSERGVAELEALRDSFLFPVAERHITSGLNRAQQSLAILYGKEPEMTIPELNEFDFGDFEMKSHEELKDKPDFINWIAGDLDTACPNGESHNQFVKRIKRGFEIVCNLNASNTVIVCHGGVIGALMDIFFPGEKHYYAWVPDCGRGYTLEITNGKPTNYTPI